MACAFLLSLYAEDQVEAWRTEAQVQPLISLNLKASARQQYCSPNIKETSLMVTPSHLVAGPAGNGQHAISPEFSQSENWAVA